MPGVPSFQYGSLHVQDDWSRRSGGAPGLRVLSRVRALDPLPIKRVAPEFFLTIMLNYEALPGKRYYIQYPSLEFCEAGRRKVLEEQRSTIKRVGRIGGGKRSPAARRLAESGILIP
jgi:hypothetical protein